MNTATAVIKVNAMSTVLVSIWWRLSTLGIVLARR
jgi:hypothetical protein